jgi:hypothetical protein
LVIKEVANMKLLTRTKAAPKSKHKHELNQPPQFAGWINEKFRIAWVISPHRSDYNGKIGK